MNINRLSLIFIVLVFYSCHQKNVELNKFRVQNKKEIEELSLNNVKFDYKLYRNIKNSLKEINIEFELINKNEFPVCFSSMTCYGDKDLLIYNDTIVENYNMVVCCYSNPIKRTIPPKSSYKFSNPFRILNMNQKVKFGFNFKAVNCKGISKKENKNIIWGNEITLNNIEKLPVFEDSLKSFTNKFN